MKNKTKIKKIDTNTEYGEIILTEKRGSRIL